VLAWLLMILVTWATDPTSPRRPASNPSCSICSSAPSWDGSMEPCSTGPSARPQPGALP
jgi:hypothetical protein